MGGSKGNEKTMGTKRTMGGWQREKNSSSICKFNNLVQIFKTIIILNNIKLLHNLIKLNY